MSRLVAAVKAGLRTKRVAQVAGALACFGVAAFLFVLAADVTRWRDAFPADDVRYVATPEATGLWSPDTALPASLSRGALGVGEDAEIRLAIRALRLGDLNDPNVSDPELAIARNEAQARLEAVAGSGSFDRERRSRAAGLLGVLGIARLVSETQDRAALLESAVANLQFAIALDPTNSDAKFNLELALQRGRGVQLTEGAGGPNPAPGGAGAKGAGAGDPGSGY